MLGYLSVLRLGLKDTWGNIDVPPASLDSKTSELLVDATNVTSLCQNIEVVMPGLVKKFLVVAGIEGLSLHPTQRNQRSIQITYTSLELSPLPYFKVTDSLSSAEFYGIVGCQLPMQVTGSFTNLFTPYRSANRRSILLPDHHFTPRTSSADTRLPHLRYYRCSFDTSFFAV